LTPQTDSRRAERGVLFAVALGTILAPLNSTMIAVAVPAIADDFDASISTVSWLVTAYLIVIGALQPVAGRLGDRFGRRRLFLVGHV
jgi:MFS family permease